MKTRALPLLLVEDDPALRGLIVEELEAQGLRVEARESLREAVAWLEGNLPALVVTDLRLPDGSGMSLVKRIGEQFAEERRPGVIVITAFGSVRQAVEALREGADDFLTKPLDLEHFLISVRRVLETRRLKDELFRLRRLSRQDDFHGLFGRSPPMRALVEQVRVIARADGPVLITGESGTGKELVAHALHRESARSDGPFLAVNCAAVPQHLLESEFFGHAPGAFTGAASGRRGLLQEADGGTLLLDEIGEMPLPLQAKLLRALQDGSIRPVGRDQEEKVDVRMLAATHQDLKRQVEEGAFREDLYYRLETFSLHLPPLRERGEDKELLAHRFLRGLAIRQGKEIDGFGPDALLLLRRYPFPGNVRELHNVIERAAAFCREGPIRAEHLPERLRSPAGAGQRESPAPDEEEALLAGDMLPTLDELQRRYARLILRKAGGNKRRAAALLGIGRRTLYRWLDEDR